MIINNLIFVIKNTHLCILLVKVIKYVLMWFTFNFLSYAFISKVRMVFLTILSLFILITSGIFFFQEKLIFFPEKLKPNYQFDFTHDFEEVNYRVSDGVTINALHFKSKEPKGIVFYSHGNAGSLSTWGDVADVFLNNKYDLLIYDYRGFGKSGGNISEQKFYHDANVIYEELLKSYEENKIIVYGRSIGTGVALKVASEHNPQHLILESPYYNLPDLVKKIFPFMPPFLLRYKFRNDQMIGAVKCPVTIFHGTFDEVIYFGSSLKLEKLMKGKDTIVPIVGGHHNDLANFETYHKELAKILH